MPSQPLVPLNIDLPANRGISSEAYAGGLSADWAQIADNCIFDAFGRLCAREAFKKTTTNPVLGHPSVDTLFEYVKDTATTHMISVTGEPRTSTNWAASKVYVVGDVVRAAAVPTTAYFLVCSVAGTSAGTEPSWNAADAAVTADNTARWTTVLVGRICTGEGTLVERNGAIAVSETHWKFQNFETEVIGFAQGEDPIYWDGSATDFATLHSKHAAYATGTAYALGATVKAAASPTTTYYLVCKTAGTSGSSEPTWATANGASTSDNTAVWTTVHMPKGKEVLSAYGRVFALREDRTTIDYSALGFPHKFDSVTGGGSIDTSLVFARNDDFITAIATFNNNLVIFSRFNTLIFNNINVPSELAIVDQVVGTGCIARDSVKNIGDEVIFLSFQGLRALGRTIQLEKVPLQELSVFIRDELINEVRSNLPSATDDTAIKSEYSPELGIYVLKVGDLIYCFDFKKSFNIKDGFNPPRVTTWTAINVQSIALTRDGKLNLAKAGALGVYSGYNEYGLEQGKYIINKPYLLSWRSAWIDMGEIDPSLRSRVKFVKKYNAYFLGGTGYDVDFTIGYDFKDSVHRRTKTLTASSGSEWSSGEWGLAEWSGDTENRFAMVQHGGSGDTMQLGIDVNIDGSGFCISRVIIYIKLGRLARGSAT